MRPIEIVLSIANLLTFFSLTAPLPRTLGWIWHVAPIALLIAIIHVLQEGSRWQMAPAYVLTGLFFIIWLLVTTGWVSRQDNRKQTNSRAIGVTAGLGIIVLALSLLLPTLLPVFRFPAPTGPYAIGTLTYDWNDSGRLDPFTKNPKERRELIVQIWYPAKQDQRSQYAPYVNDVDAFAALARLLQMPGFTFSHIKYVTTNAIESAPVADDKPNFPILIFLEGATGFRQMNTFQVEEFVSHGYIVAAIDQPYTAVSVVFPDGRQIDGLSFDKMKPLIHQSHSPDEQAPTLNGQTFEKGIVPFLAQDVTFVINRLAALNESDPNSILVGRLDLQHVGAFGISLGGIVVSESCRLDSRLRACLVMDAPMSTDVVKFGLRQPAMWITRDVETMRFERQRAGGWSEIDIREHQSTMQAAFNSSVSDGYFIQVPGMFHVNMTDIPYWSPVLFLLGITGPIDARRAHSIINAYSLRFFNRHLKGSPAMGLDELVIQYPEVIVESRHP